MDTINAIDVDLFHLLNNLLGKSHPFDIAIIFFAKYLIFVLGLLVLFSLGKDFVQEPKRRFTLNLGALIGTIFTVIAVTQVIRALYHHSRPLFALGTPHILFESSYSFPSMHTILIFGVATAVYFYNRRLAYGIYASGVLVGIARVIAGVHYPFDIVGGIILGVGSGLLVEVVLRHAFGVRKRLRIH